MKREQIEATKAKVEGLAEYVWISQPVRVLAALCTLALEGLEAREQRQSRVEYTKSARAALKRKPE